MGQNYGIAYATLDGGDGNDTLTASGVLQLTMTGGAGVNKFVLTAQQYRTESEGARTFTNSDYTTTIVNADPTVITDFKAGAGGDLLDYSDLLRSSLYYDGTNPFASGYISLVQSGADTLFQYDPDGSAGSSTTPITVARLLNVTATTLVPANFNPNYAADGSIPAGQLITGDEFDNTLIGAAGNDTIYGLGGNDTIDGQAGKCTESARSAPRPLGRRVPRR